MESVPPFDANAKPEELYRNTQDLKQRRRLAGQVVAAHASKIDRLLRRLKVPGQHMAEARQEAALSVLQALEVFEPGRSAAFWTFAFVRVRDAVRVWMGKGVYWAPHVHGGKGDEKQRERESAARRLVHDILDEEKIVEDDCNPEQLAESKEIYDRLLEFKRDLSERDSKNLFSDHGRCTSSPRHKSLVERATAFVRGPDVLDDDS